MCAVLHDRLAPTGAAIGGERVHSAGGALGGVVRVAEGDRDRGRIRGNARGYGAEKTGRQSANTVSTLFWPSSIVVTRRNGTRRPSLVR